MDKDLSTILNSRVSTPTKNKWCSNFTNTKKLADSSGIPLIAIVSKDRCPNCRTMEASILNNTYKSWMAGSGFLFYFSYLGDKNAADLNTAKAFTKSGDTMPFSRIWWSVGG